MEDPVQAENSFKKSSELQPLKMKWGFVEAGTDLIANKFPLQETASCGNTPINLRFLYCKSEQECDPF